MGSIVLLIATLLAGCAIGVFVSKEWEVDVGKGIAIGLVSLLLSVWGYAKQDVSHRLVEGWIRSATAAYTDTDTISKSLEYVDTGGEIYAVKAHIAGLMNSMTGFLGWSSEEMQVPHVVVFDVVKRSEE